MEIQRNKEAQAVQFGRIINLLLLFIIFIVSCNNKNNTLGYSNNSYPTIEVLFKDDTIYLNKEFEVKIYLNDTSLFYFYDNRKNKYVRIHPHFKINDSLIYNNSDTLVHKFSLKRVPLNNYLPNFYEWTCSVIVPHPIKYEGDIEFKKRFDNYVTSP